VSGSFWPGILNQLLAGEELTGEVAAEAMRRILAEEATPAELAAFALALRAKGEGRREVGGLAEAMLERAPAVETPGPVVDTSGTGGDGAGILNVSTLAAIVAAGAGVLVAKQGDRAVSSQCGSADLLEGLGVNIGLGPEGVTRCLFECGIGFMFVPAFHPAIAHAKQPLATLGIATVFDFLGPLANPARPAGQVVGVFEPRMEPALAGVLADRKIRAYVVRGEDGLDEITTTAPTHVLEVAGGVVLERHLLPIEMGVPTSRLEDLKGGDVEKNVGLAKDVLEGVKGPARDIVAINAGAALAVAGKTDELLDGLEMAYESIDSGAAGRALSRWVEVSNKT
jgi:anthranilate phosphoribosyltransferase